MLRGRQPTRSPWVPSWSLQKVSLSITGGVWTLLQAVWFPSCLELCPVAQLPFTPHFHLPASGWRTRLALPEGACFATKMMAANSSAACGIRDSLSFLVFCGPRGFSCLSFFGFPQSPPCGGSSLSLFYECDDQGFSGGEGM